MKFSNEGATSTLRFRRILSRTVGTLFLCLGFLGVALRDVMQQEA